MFKLNKKVLGAVFAVGLLIATLGVAQAQTGIQFYDIEHYRHATQVLKQEYPAFLTAFQAFRDEIKTIDSANKQAQHDALMRFFPFIDELAFMDSYVADTLDYGIRWDLQKEVLVSYFVINLPTADNKTTSVHDVLFDSFKVYLANGDATGILPEDIIMQKHNMTREQAQRVRTVLHKLYPTSTLCGEGELC